jgi:hypothetical protein
MTSSSAVTTRDSGWVQIECSGVNSSDTGYFREFSWEA